MTVDLSWSRLELVRPRTYGGRVERVSLGIVRARMSRAAMASWPDLAGSGSEVVDEA